MITSFGLLRLASQKKLKAGVIGLCYGLSLSMPALADDTEIYSNSAAVDPSIQPNVLFLLDTSNSMGKEATNAEDYVATEDYADAVKYPSAVPACFDDKKIYRLGSGSAKDNATAYCASGGTTNEVKGRVSFSKFFCEDALMIDQNGGAGNQIEASDSPGFYSGKVGRYNKGASKNTKRWRQINNTSSQVVECKADAGLHGYLAGNSKKYATKKGGKNGNSRWTDNPADQYDWSNLGTRTVYTGNYLNYLIVTESVDSYRVEVIRDAMIAFVETAADINLGFMPYSKKTENGHSKGAMIEVAIDDITNTRADIIRRLKVYGTRHDATNTSLQSGHKNLILGTPSARQYYEALRYFKGNAPVYGADSKGPSIGSAITDDPDGSGPLTTPFDVVAFPSVADSLDGSGNYKSPIANECQQNYVILLTDGLPFADSIDPGQLTEMGISNTSCTNDPSCVNGRCETTCLPLFAEAGAKLTSVNGNQVQPVSTFTIGFALDPNTDKGQRAITALQGSSSISKQITGKGESFLASNADELRNHLVTIVEALDVSATFSSPAVSVNAFNRTVHLDDLFFTLFEPGTGPHWDGNFKKYKLSVRKDPVTGDPVLDDNGRQIPVIVDSSDPPIEAIDSDTGFFQDNAKSFWSVDADGAKVVLGGTLAGFATRSSARNIYTYRGNYSTVGDVEVPADKVIIQNDNKVTSSNKTNITDVMLGIDAADTIQDGLNNTVLLHDALLDWAAGIDVLDSDGDDDITDPREVMGDPLHSQPGIVQYGETAGVADLVAFVATNDGYLHAIDANSGEELWAFIPQELLPLLNTNLENKDGTPKGYGLDGDVVAWVDDVGEDGTITPGTDRVILYIGQRRGGKKIYAIDVTTRTNPKLLWVINGGVSGTAYEELGQTWSTVNVEQVKSNGTSKTVLIFGGGYDTRHDNDDVSILPRTAPSSPLDPARDDSVGRTVFVADALTGEVLWSAGKGSASPTAHMDYSIAARVKPLDLSGDGNIDRLYVADLGGQVFRFDFDEAALDSTAFGSAAIKGGRIADLSKDDSLEDARRFYYPPDVAIVAERGKQAYLGIALSSGYRAHPNNTDIHDRIYLLKDRNVFTAPASYTTLKESDLYNATLNQASLPENATQAQIDASAAALTSIGSAEGWYIDLDNEATPPVFVGEKGLAEPLIVEGSVVITTFVPETGASLDSCRPKEGSGKVFFLDLVDGTASYPTDSDAREDRYRGLHKGGIPASPNVIITTDAVPTVCIGTECESLGASVGLRKTFWYEVEK